ncbi:hypothetical protein [Microbacterium binotii]|uniref:Uncharacterized protein n=1 Tax=Microbacterium binotii TaxID=462710 RepID=A0ABN3P8J3_9MICO
MGCSIDERVLTRMWRAGEREVVYRRSIPLATQHLAIMQSPTAERAAVLGAAMLVVREVLSAENVNIRVPQAAD